MWVVSVNINVNITVNNVNYCFSAKYIVLKCSAQATILDTDDGNWVWNLILCYKRFHGKRFFVKAH